MQQARTIAVCMFQYATDHDNAYPDGNSSTEVFQKLLDEKYCSDPSIFYISLPGKIPAVTGEKLKPENVSFDVTSGVDANAPDKLPVAFMTGYKVTYVPGGSAVPLVKPYPPFWTRTWQGWWRGEPKPPCSFDPSGPGIAVGYKGNNATFLKPTPVKNSDGSTSYPLVFQPDASIPNFIPPDFDAKGKIYRQLTPDGPLP